MCKAYAFDRWLAAVRAITYPVDILVVDNSPNGEMAARYGDQIPMVVLPNPSEHPYERINASMEVIRRIFLGGTWDRWFNLECDIIPPPNIVDVLLDYGAEADWCGHGYPVRGGSKQEVTGIGCAMLSRALAGAFSFTEANQDSPDVWLWEMAKDDGRFRTVEVWRMVAVEHLRE